MCTGGNGMHSVDYQRCVFVRQPRSQHGHHASVHVTRHAPDARRTNRRAPEVGHHRGGLQPVQSLQRRIRVALHRRCERLWSTLRQSLLQQADGSFRFPTIPVWPEAELLVFSYGEPGAVGFLSRPLFSFPRFWQTSRSAKASEYTPLTLPVSLKRWYKSERITCDD